jgi:hypothetical protein
MSQIVKRANDSNVENDSNVPNDYLGSRSGISATAYEMAAIAAAAFDTSSDVIRSTVSAALW